MGMDLFSEALRLHLCIINAYGPCTNRQQFWTSLESSILRPDNIILASDLNLSPGISKSRGPNSHANTLSDYFRKFLSSHHLVDPLIISPSPTWRNRHTGDDLVARRLDHFLIKEGLLQNIGFFRKWIGSSGIFDHSLIYLEITRDFKKSASPFKFCSVWLQDLDYIKLVDT